MLRFSTREFKTFFTQKMRHFAYAELLVFVPSLNQYKAKAMASCHFVMSLPFRSRFEAWFSGWSLNLSNFSQLFIPDHVWSEGDLYKSSPTHRLLDMSPYLQNLDVKQSLRQRLNILLICLTRVAACVTSQLGWSKIFRQLNDIPMIRSKQSRLSAGSNLV